MRKQIKTLEDANEHLYKTTSQVLVLQYGGSVTAPSVFKNLVTNREFSTTLNSLIKRIRSTPIERIGVGQGRAKSATKPPKLDLAGCTNVSQLPSVKAKKRATCLARYGVSTNLKSKDTKQKIKQTNQDRYGHACSLHGGVGLEKKLARWNGSHPLSRPEVISKTRATRERSGLNKLIQGVPLSTQARTQGVAYSTLQSALKHKGEAHALSLEPDKSSYETLVMSWIRQYNPVCNKQLLGSRYRPDFVIESHKLIIEVDGLYWHSDAVQANNQYHVTKQQTYTDLGYRSLFFRTDELDNCPQICESMILHKLHLSRTVMARKCQIVEVGAAFFDENHLMGSRAHDKIVGLMYDGVCVAALAFRWKNKATRQLEVSRFSTKLGHSVTGAYTRLLAHIVQLESPASIFTYVDLRYGNPAYMCSLGFAPQKTWPSFRWTDGKQSFHRMKYPGNSGYAAGLHKIWDCGQAAFVKHL